MTPRTYTSFCAVFAIWGLLGPLHGGAALAAPPSFELDLKDLETTKPTSKPRRPTTSPPKKESRRETKTPPVAPAPETADDYSRYTVKPGDFLFRILIRDFGLSNAQAEALIPEIQRLNKLPSATRLDVGQTILIPRPRRTPSVTDSTTDIDRPPASAETAPLVIPPAPSLAPVQPPTVSAPPESVTTQQGATPEKSVAAHPAAPPVSEPNQKSEIVPHATPTAAEATFSTALIRFWEDLVPGQERIEPLTVNGRVLDPTDYPLLLASDGGRILVDLRDTLPPQLRSQLSQKYPDIRIVTRGKDSLRLFFSTLMKAAEFARIEENVTVDLGADPSLTIRADFRIVRLPAGGRGPETVLLFVDEHGPCLPASLGDYLGRKGYQVAQFCRGSAHSFAEPGYDLRAIPSSTPCDMVMSLLDSLSLKLDRNRIVSGAMGAGSDNRFSIRVEGYFETGGKRFILNCSGNDPYNYTLFRLLQVQGYGVVQPQDSDDFSSVTERLLAELNYPHTFGRHELDYGRYRIAITGFKVTRRESSTGRLLITSRPSDPVFADLLRWEPRTNNSAMQSR